MLNRVEIIGNLGKDPEIRSTQNGQRVANFSVAVSERWTDKQSGEKKERTEWVPVAIWNDGLVSVAEKYLRKGSRVYVAGQFQTRKWTTQDGADRYTTEVTLRFDGKLLMLDRKSDDERANVPASSSGDYKSRRSTEPKKPADNFDDLDDEIPF